MFWVEKFEPSIEFGSYVDIEHFCLLGGGMWCSGMLLEGKRLREDNEKKIICSWNLEDGRRHNFI